MVSVDSIEPEGGPTTGDTRVLVRGGPFKDLEILFPKPKCKFGRHDLVVDATYVLCTNSPTPIEHLEPRHRQKVKIQISYLFRTIHVFNAKIVQKLRMMK